MQFLRQKIELAADGTAIRQELLCLCYMRNETIEFLADIGFGCKQDSFLVEPIRVETLGSPEQS